VGDGLYVGAVIGFLAAAVLLWGLQPVGRHIGLVDHPGGRKTHEHPTPLVGGIAMFIAFAFAILTVDSPLSGHRALFAGALILVVVGVLDDLQELSARARFAAQFLAGLIMTLGAGVVLHDFGHLMLADQPLPLGMLAIPLTLFATVGVINAVNLSDGIDGLAASLVLIAVGSLLLIAWPSGQREVVGLLVVLVFMGDAGSMFLGFVLAWFLVRLSQGEARLFAPVTALWLFALPLIDTVVTMSRRIRLGRSPFAADREHFHHILLAAGFTPKQTVGLMVLLASALAGIGLIGHFQGVPEHWMFWGFLVVAGSHYWLVMRVWRVKRFLSRPLLQHAESRV
jgi:UDP-GlcNAc:undecaprenyl-phosphate GlcNAc-1-phosphate transferase